MTTLCPRCSAPRPGEYPTCQVCGLDFRTLAQAAASACPRCQAPLYPGYTRCGNCGFDSAQWVLGVPPTNYASGMAPFGAVSPFGAAAPTAEPAASKMPILVAIGGIFLMAVAGGLVLAIAIKGSSTPASPSPQPVAIVKATDKPLPTFDYNATPAPTAEPTLGAATTLPPAGPSLAPATPEPSPHVTWSNYASPDKKWTVRFPSSMTPLNQSLPLTSGAVQGSMTMYVVMDTLSTAYGVAYIDFPAGTIPGGAGAALKSMEPSLAASFGGVLEASSDSKVGSIPALDMTVAASGLNYDLRLFIVNDRMYMLMVLADPGTVVYPQHFFSTFVVLK